MTRIILTFALILATSLASAQLLMLTLGGGPPPSTCDGTLQVYLCVSTGTSVLGLP